MYTLLKPIQIREELLKRGLRVFTAQEFRRIFETTPDSTKYLLESQVRSGFLARLKRGIYTLSAEQPSEEEIANALYRPSYISFEYALAYYHLLPEMPYTVTSATTKPTRLCTISNSAYSYKTIKKEAYTGYMLVKQDQRSFLIADKEKALVDYFYFYALHKSPANERLFENLKRKEFLHRELLDTEKIQRYAELFGNKPLLRFIATFL